MGMIIETLLREALATRLGLLSEAGFKGEVQELYERLTTADETAYHQAFECAWTEARGPLGDDILTPLLNHPPFQETAVGALLEPERGFDVQSAAEALGDRYASSVRLLNRFFSKLKIALEDDEHWGALLEPYQTVSLRDDVQQALQAQQLDVSVHDVIRRVRTLLVGAGAVYLNSGT